LCGDIGLYSACFVSAPLRRIQQPDVAGEFGLIENEYVRANLHPETPDVPVSEQTSWLVKVIDGKRTASGVHIRS
jgi:hypothetical protein